jgi:hypothetical protein
MVDPGIVEQNIDTTELLQRLIDSLPAIFREAHIGADEYRRTTSIVDFLCDLLASLLVASGEDDRRPFLGEQGGGGAPDARGSASNQRDLAV